MQVDSLIMDAMKEKVTARAATSVHHANLPSRQLALESCTALWHKEAVVKYVTETTQPALRMREARDAKVGPLITAVRSGDFECLAAPAEPTEQHARFLRLYTDYVRLDAEAIRKKALMHDVYSKYASKDSEASIVREAIVQARQAVHLVVQAREMLERDDACGFVNPTTTAHVAEEVVATDLGVSTASLLRELHTATGAAATGKMLFARAINKSTALPSPIKRSAVHIGKSLQPSGGVALERSRRDSRHPHASLPLPFRPGLAQAWDVSLVGTGVAYCSDHTAPAGGDWICGRIFKCLGGQRFELRLDDKQKLTMKLPTPRVRYLPAQQREDAPAAAPPPLELRPAQTALALLLSTSAGEAAEATTTDSLRALSAEERTVVESSWALPHDDTLLPCPGHNHPVSRKDVSFIRPCTDRKHGRKHWATDAVLNPLFLVLRARLGMQSNVEIFLSSIGTLLLRADYRINLPVLVNCLKHVAKGKLFERLQWLFPIMAKGHWFVVQVDFLLKQIVVYDSLPEARRLEESAAARRAVHRFVADLHLQERKRPFDWSGWQQAHLRLCDQSGPDWYNCGIFAFLTLWCLARRATISLKQHVAPSNMAAETAENLVWQWRERLVLWLRTGKVPV